MAKHASKTVWGISYRFKRRDQWAGPCGVYYMNSLPADFKNSDRPHFPFFFRTRKLARQEAATHKCVHTKVSKYKLTWEEV